RSRPAARASARIRASPGSGPSSSVASPSIMSRTRSVSSSGFLPFIASPVRARALRLGLAVVVPDEARRRAAPGHPAEHHLQVLGGPSQLFPHVVAREIPLAE